MLGNGILAVAWHETDRYAPAIARRDVDVINPARTSRNKPKLLVILQKLGSNPGRDEDGQAFNVLRDLTQFITKRDLFSGQIGFVVLLRLRLGFREINIHVPAAAENC